MQRIFDTQGREKYNGWGRHEVPLEMYRHVNGGGGLTTYLIAGYLGGATSMAGQQVLTSGTVFAAPVIWPGGTLDQLSCKITTSAGTQRVYIGLYNNLKDTLLVPTTLVVGSTELSVTATTVVATYATTVTSLVPGGLYWAAITSDAGGVHSCQVVPVAGCWPIFGLAADLNILPGVGLTVARPSYTTLPATFPLPVTRRNANMPAIGLRSI